MNMASSTIAAIATPLGSGGIGIVRVTGEAAADILATVFQHKGKRSDESAQLRTAGFVSHRMYFGNIIDPRDSSFIDEVLVVLMKAPHSYTTEDVVEIQTHAGYVVLKRVLALVLAQGARLAEPGEFTRRAFLNGRIDLTQAEAVADVINAKTGMSLAIAGGQLKGMLGKEIGIVRDHLLMRLAEIEADIDFAEDVDEPLDPDRMAEEIKIGALQPLERLIMGYENRRFFRDGLKMAIVGRPNVGKSSLLNRMIRRERAIVTEIPGTTRDSIEEMIDIDGLPVMIIDTAGLHETSQAIERLGIERTLAALEEADLVLFVIDLSQGVTKADRDIYGKIGDKRCILVQNKNDLKEDTPLPNEWRGIHNVSVSALEGTNIDKLRRAIYDIGVSDAGTWKEASLVPNLRQADALKKCCRFAKSAQKTIAKGGEMDFAALDLKASIERLDEILGLNCKEDMLDTIFSRFCVGK